MNKTGWIASIATLGALDYYFAHIKKHGTLSDAGRDLFRTDTRVGKIAWVTGWTGLSVWLVPHILKTPEKIVEMLEDL